MQSIPNQGQGGLGNPLYAPKYAVPTQDRQPTEIQTELNQQKDVIQQLQVAISELHNRLSSILRQSTPQPDAPNQKLLVQLVPLAEELRHANQDIVGAVMMIRDIHERIELPTNLG